MGRDPAHFPDIRSISCFNPRARVGRDRNKSVTLSCCSKVSIHAPAWGATFSERQAEIVSKGFNPRARVGRDQSTGVFMRLAPMFQSTRPRGARLLHQGLPLQVRYVSIHAPAWGATPAAIPGRRDIKVSIHAPAWGATTLPADLDTQTFVSIHAPAWGATKTPLQGVASDAFQSTRPRGARPRASAPSTAGGWFQSTRPRGARPCGQCLPCRINKVSIHAPAWGATDRGRRGPCLPPGFNPRARVGRDLLLISRFRTWVSFNPRARVGRDRRATILFCTIQCFNPRARVGRDGSPSFGS